jgi:hypothetical protein
MVGSKYDRADEQAAVITPPREGSVIIRDIILTVDIVLIPTAWKNKWVNLIAMGNDAYFVTGKDTSFGVLALTQTSVDPSTKAPTMDIARPFPMPQGAIVPYYFDDVEDAYIAVSNPSLAGGKWYGAPASPTTGMT